MIGIKSLMSKSAVKLAVNGTVGAAVIALLVLGIYALSILARQQSAEYHAKQQEIRELDRKLEITSENVLRLEREKERMRTPQGVEDAARSRLGMVRPGEVVYVVNEHAPAAPAAETERTQHAYPNSNSLYFRVLGNVIY